MINQPWSWGTGPDQEVTSYSDFDKSGCVNAIMHVFRLGLELCNPLCGIGISTSYTRLRSMVQSVLAYRSICTCTICFVLVRSW